jgi:hypothetical protein
VRARCGGGIAAPHAHAIMRSACVRPCAFVGVCMHARSCARVRANPHQPFISSFLTPLHAAGALLAAAAHDLGRPGAVTNAYLVATSHRLALAHNDVAVLQNFAAAEFFKVSTRHVHVPPLARYAPVHTP